MQVLAAFCTGLVVGVILIESMTTGLLVLLPEDVMTVHAADAGRLVWPLLPVPALVWLVGGAACGAMASAVAGSAIVGSVAGALLAVPAMLIVNLVSPGDPLCLLAAALPLSGAAAGSVLAARLERSDATVSAPGQAV